MFLALFNLGAPELLLVLVLLVVFFGVDKLPETARRLGRMKAQFDRLGRQWTAAIETEEDRMMREMLEFERVREQQVLASQADADDGALRRAAAELGIPHAGRSPDELRALIAARVAKAKPGSEEV